LTTATPIERVVAILTEANFQPRAPLRVASVPFDFAAVLVGTGRSPDLIVVVDTVEEQSELRLRQKIDGLGRALDIAGSRRPLTAVLVGPKPSDVTLEAISRVCRVLPVGTPTGQTADAELHDWLSVLLPLPLPHPGQAVADPAGALAARLPADLHPALRGALVTASAQGASMVREELARLLAAPLEGVERYADDVP
jgi:hypothetical protein